MHSWEIAKALEKAYPTPSLHLDYEHVATVQELIGKFSSAIMPAWMPKVPRNLLNPVSAEYFQRTRAEQVGKPLEQYEKEDTDERWNAAEKHALEVARLLKTNGGPFFLGKQVSYADFILVGFLHFLKRIDISMYERAVDLDPALKTVYEASQKWLSRDDH